MNVRVSGWMCNARSLVAPAADTVRGWCTQAAIDASEQPGTTACDAQRIEALEAEARELLTVKWFQLSTPGQRSPLTHFATFSGSDHRAALPESELGAAVHRAC